MKLGFKNLFISLDISATCVEAQEVIVHHVIMDIIFNFKIL